MNNHRSESAEIEFSGSLVTMELKKPHPSTLVGRAQMWNRLHICYIHMWWIKIQGGHPGSKESQLHDRSPSPWYKCQEDKFP